MRDSFFVALVSLFVFAAESIGGISITDGTRRAQSLVNPGPNVDPVADTQQSDMLDGLFQGSTFVDLSDGPNGHAVSNVQYESIVDNNEFRSVASGSISITSYENQFVFAASTWLEVIHFWVDEPTRISVDASLSIENGNGVQFSLYNSHTGQAPLVYSFASNDEYHEEYLLEQGPYRFAVQAESSLAFAGNSTVSRSWSSDILVRVIPAPSSLALLSIAGIASTRRRR
jgi:hypothetical protein